MAYEEALDCISVPAGSDLSSSQYRFMTINSSGQLAATGDGLKADGILQDDPAAQARASALAIAGVSKLVAGAAVTAGDDVASDSVGRGVTAATGDIINGRALTSASGAGVIFSVLISHTYEPLA